MRRRVENCRIAHICIDVVHDTYGVENFKVFQKSVQQAIDNITQYIYIYEGFLLSVFTTIIATRYLLRSLFFDDISEMCAFQTKIAKKMAKKNYNSVIRYRHVRYMVMELISISFHWQSIAESVLRYLSVLTR